MANIDYAKLSTGTLLKAREEERQLWLLTGDRAIEMARMLVAHRKRLVEIDTELLARGVKVDEPFKKWDDT